MGRRADALPVSPHRQKEKNQEEPANSGSSAARANQVSVGMRDHAGQSAADLELIIDLWEGIRIG